MQKNYTASRKNLQQGRYHTLITSMFSHADPFHYAVNMFGLYSFGPAMIAQIGLRRFAYFYLGGGVASSATTVVSGKSSLGASGGLMSIFANFALLFPYATIYVIVFPVPARMALAGFAVYDWFFMSDKNSSIDHFGHLGGLTWGLVNTFLLFRGQVRF